MEVNLIQQKGEWKMTDTDRLKKAIEKSGIKIGAILQKMDIKSYSTLREKIENRREFTASEIYKLCEILHFNNEEMNGIFFASEGESHSA